MWGVLLQAVDHGLHSFEIIVVQQSSRILETKSDSLWSHNELNCGVLHNWVISVCNLLCAFICIFSKEFPWLSFVSYFEELECAVCSLNDSQPCSGALLLLKNKVGVIVGIQMAPWCCVCLSQKLFNLVFQSSDLCWQIRKPQNIIFYIIFVSFPFFFLSYFIYFPSCFFFSELRIIFHMNTKHLKFKLPPSSLSAGCRSHPAH